ncbi:hypothetical protein DESC_530008 [Desulfosarcina cetonica]|nr:hypothetical protein DESC_530008 [Desulfosarcina cetonica]
MSDRSSEPINIAIMENEKDSFDWQYNPLAEEMYWFVDFFNIAFFKDKPVPIPAISFDRSRIKTFGHYVIGRNAFGVSQNINLNSRYLNRPLWEILKTLLHEMAHSYEYIYVRPEKRTKSWYHSKAFREKMMDFGLECDEKGQLRSLNDPFVFLLKKHGVTFPEEIERRSKSYLNIIFAPESKGKSKTKKWSCDCTNVRVAIKDFRAKCLKCHKEFELNE